jgi:hypothetical protein
MYRQHPEILNMLTEGYELLILPSVYVFHANKNYILFRLIRQ